jgi:predicted nucleic acid-binding protein
LHQLDGREQGTLFLLAISLAELRFGIAASQRQAKNLEWFELFLAAF